MSDSRAQCVRDPDAGTEEEFKRAMANYPTGVAVVTTMAKSDAPVGLTVNSLVSVSLSPLMLLWSISRRANCAEEFAHGPGFAVHILAADQQDQCTTFASPVENRFGRHPWHLSARGLPILEGAAAVLECSLARAIDAGDHVILLGNVIAASVQDRDPLVYHRRGFGSISSLPQAS